VLVVTDVKRGDVAALAGAYARLIEAAGGGTLGLFTAIQRMKAVHARLADRLARAGLPLYAQHVDPNDTGTLVDIFRDDPRASLLGHGRVARRGRRAWANRCGSSSWRACPGATDRAYGARRAAAEDRPMTIGWCAPGLAQGVGRLIRRKEDRGMFVLLSAATPSRLLTAFPPGVSIRRVTIAEAIERVRSCLSTDTALGQIGEDMTTA
jgi:ATP-dependent DNA helicase DinG